MAIVVPAIMPMAMPLERGTGTERGRWRRVYCWAGPLWCGGLHEAGRRTLAACNKHPENKTNTHYKRP